MKLKHVYRSWRIAVCICLASCASPPDIIYSGSVSLPSVYEQPRARDIRTHDLIRAVPPQGPFQPNANLFACSVHNTNMPTLTSQHQIVNFSPIIVAFGRVMAAAPVNDVCLSSGFGPRAGRMHKGIDLYSSRGGTIYSAAPGQILELSAQSGFGNQLVLDHGDGVYTRYAHLASFAPDLKVGDIIGFGVALGTMGRTGNATGIHLHFEILTGDYDTPRHSFGLKAHNPLDFPAWAGLETEP